MREMRECEEGFAFDVEKSTSAMSFPSTSPTRKPGTALAENMHMIRTLTNQEARRLLQSAPVARLGCIVNGEPYVVPLNCHLEGDYLYSHSLAGQKIAALRENPNACVQVDEIESELRWRSAIAFGKYEEITRPGERADILNALLRRFPMLTPVESTIAIDGAAAEVIVFRIKIERLTGVSEGWAGVAKLTQRDSS